LSFFNYEKISLAAADNFVDWINRGTAAGFPAKFQLP
jgi:hypothetical protein